MYGDRRSRPPECSQDRPTAAHEKSPQPVDRYYCKRTRERHAEAHTTQVGAHQMHEHTGKSEPHAGQAGVEPRGCEYRDLRAAIEAHRFFISNRFVKVEAPGYIVQIGEVCEERQRNEAHEGCDFKLGPRRSSYERSELLPT